MVRLTFPRPDEGVAVLVDLDKCIGCRACQVACKEWNGREAEKTEFSPTFTNPPSLTANSWKVVFFHEFIKTYFAGFEDPFIQPVPYNCLHCAEAPCARACPVGAIKVTEEGAVVIEASECIGCGFCEMACPFDVPKRGDDGKYYKCTFCVDRIQAGMAPACVDVCPTEVFEFGPASEIMARAREEEAKGRVVYGLELDDYVGGAVRWIYVASRDREQAIKMQFPDKAVVSANSAREALNAVVKAGAGALAIALTILGLASWRMYRAMEKRAREEAGEEGGGQQAAGETQS